MFWADLWIFLKALPAIYGLWQTLRNQFGDNALKVVTRTDEAYQKLVHIGSEQGAFEAAKALQDVIHKL